MSTGPYLAYHRAKYGKLYRLPTIDKGCLIAVTIELREHAVVHAARVLREGGATPAQTKVGIHLALGKTRTVIADELGLQLCSGADRTKKLYRTLDVHNSTELGTKIWLNQKQDERQSDPEPAAVWIGRQHRGNDRTPRNREGPPQFACSIVLSGC